MNDSYICNESNKKLQNLTKKQVQAIPILLHARTITEGTEKAGITRTTFYQWMKQSEFREEFENRIQEMLNHAYDEFRLSIVDSISALRQILNDVQWTEYDMRFKIAISLIDRIPNLTNLKTLENRVSALEDRISSESKEE
jgi:predicted transcriptional regulator